MKTSITLGLIWLLFILYNIVTWIINLIKFIGCDFDAPYKEEILHGLGLFTPIYWVTAWL